MGGKPFAPITVPGLQAYGALCKVQPSKFYQYYCPVYTTIYNTVLGFNLYTPSLKLNHADSPYQEYYFNASLNKQRQWNSLPHYIDNTNTTLTISRQPSRSLHMYAGYEIQNIGDHYINGGYEQCTGPGTTYCPGQFHVVSRRCDVAHDQLRIQRHTDPDFQFLDARSASRGLSDSGAGTFRVPCKQHSGPTALFVVVGTAAV